jgi:predicted nucleic acid-binding OB-fold protein
MGDFWNPKNKVFHSWEEIEENYGLKEGEKIIWERIIDNLLKERTHRLIKGVKIPKDKEWV